MAVFQLEKNGNQSFVCPKCHRELHFISGGAVTVKNGQVDMEAAKPKYECTSCGVYYKELLNTSCYVEYDMPHKVAAKLKNIRRTGDLEPMEIKKDDSGRAVCPRCGEMMDFVDGQPVRIINGKPDMENVKDHFHCRHCHSTFRRIASTDYFQWSEK